MHAKKKKLFGFMSDHSAKLSKSPIIIFLSKSIFNVKNPFNLSENDFRTKFKFYENIPLSLLTNDYRSQFTDF